MGSAHMQVAYRVPFHLLSRTGNRNLLSAKKIKCIRNLPEEIDKVGFITALADNGVDYMYYLRSEICFEKAIFRKKAEVNVKEVYDRFGNLIDKLFEEGHIQNRILAGFLKKKVEVVLEKVIGTSANVFIFD